MNKYLLALIILTFLTSYSFGATIGSSVDPSLNSYSARPMGLGRAYVALSDDGSAIFTNPAGLGFAKYLQISATSATLLSSIKSTAAAYAYPTNWGTFGIAVVALSESGSYPTIRDPSNSGRIITNPSGEAISYENNVLLLSYSKKLPMELSLGINLKFFNQFMSGTGITGGKGEGKNIDLGVLYKPRKWLSIGANMQNALSNTIKWSGTNTEENIGGYSKAGFAATLIGKSALVSNESHQLLVLGDYFIPNSNLLQQSKTNSLHFGIEYKALNTLSIRLGQDQGRLTYGVGLEQTGFRFDYAYNTTPDLAGYDTHYFTLSLLSPPPVPLIQKPKVVLPIALKILSPITGTITTAETTRLSVSSKNIQNLYAFRINNVEYVQTTKESFELIEPLKPGKNIFTVAAINPKGLVMASAECRILRSHYFIDVPMTFWAAKSIYQLSNMNIVQGFPDRTFLPDKGITRAELVTLLQKTKNITIESISESKFKDVPVSHWAAFYIDRAVSDGIAKGFPDGTFKPNKTLSRAEAITVLIRYANLMDIKLEKDYKPFPDMPADHWANKDIEKAKRAGYLDYMEGKPFEPNKVFTRAEAVEILSKTPQISRKTFDFWNN